MAVVEEIQRMPARDCRRFICIHGHFYQPPRENPWLERIEVQDSAVPYHDWNEKICAECYAPNVHARILDAQGRVDRMVNNYEWISFDVGPTLLAWLETGAPQVLEAVQEADRRSLARFSGHGSAMAQAYNHTILPLSSRRDKEIQVEWGIEVFRHYFRRDPEGMWLPEAAVDVETLEVLVDHGICFTVLSPSQAQRFRAPGEDWADTAKRPIDPRKAYRCVLPSGRALSVFFYDGEVARQVAFERLLDSGDAFKRRLLSSFEPRDREVQLVNVATDGETYGHHHRFGEMALAFLISSLDGDRQVSLTNYGEFLSLYPPRREVEIVQNSSWSCAHGVERWRSNCGCRLGGNAFHQKWRKPLREALDNLKEKLDALFEAEGQKYFKDPWGAFREYIEVLLRRQEEKARKFVHRRASRDLQEEELSAALRLLEMERHGQLMFTSCAWFFDEISGIETVQVLRLAARAIQLAAGFSADLEEAFLKILEQAPSNDPRFENGRKLWEEEVRPAVTDLERVLAHFAMSAVFRKDVPSRIGFVFSKQDLDRESLEAGHVTFGLGAAAVTSHVTLQSAQACYAVIRFGGLDVQFFWKTYDEGSAYQALKKELVQAFQEDSLGNLYQRLLARFGQPAYQTQDLFLDEQRRIVDIVVARRVEAYREQFDLFYSQDSSLLRRLGVLRYPVPESMKMVASVATDRKINKLIARVGEAGGLQALSSLLEQARQWSYSPDPVKWERFFLLNLERRMQALEESGETVQILDQAENILKAAEILQVPLNLWNIQNHFVEVCKDREEEFLPFKDRVRSFTQRIQMSPRVLPPSLR